MALEARVRYEISICPTIVASAAGGMYTCRGKESYVASELATARTTPHRA